MEAIPDHVESRAKIQLEKWKQAVDDHHELAYLINIADHTMGSIIWRIIENE
jgi:hypothetical protein